MLFSQKSNCLVDDSLALLCCSAIGCMAHSLQGLAGVGDLDVLGNTGGGSGLDIPACTKSLLGWQNCSHLTSEPWKLNGGNFLSGISQFLSHGKGTMNRVNSYTQTQLLVKLGPKS